MLCQQNNDSSKNRICPSLIQEFFHSLADKFAKCYPIKQINMSQAVLAGSESHCPQMSVHNPTVENDGVGPGSNKLLHMNSRKCALHWLHYGLLLE
jgi:hypothetical protein